MTQVDIRSALLQVISDYSQEYGRNLQTNTILERVSQRIAPQGRPSDDIQQAILTQWHDLFRTGYLAWGLNLSNPSPPFLHVTDRGRAALSRLSRDPSNPQGYLNHINSIGGVNPVAYSYLTEGLNCFVADLYKSSAVMVGAASESIVFELRDLVVRKFEAQGSSVPSKLKEWKVKSVIDGLGGYFEAVKGQFDVSLRDKYEAFWAGFNQFIRASRNEAGHPVTIDPITFDMAHAVLLIFPEHLKLANNLKNWVG